MTATFRVIWPYLRRQWSALVMATGGTVVIAAAEVLRPFPLKFVIDHLFGAAKTGHFTFGPADIVLVLAVAGLVLGIALVEAAGDYAVDVYLERAGERIVHDLRVAIYAHLQRLSLAFHRRRHTGDLVTRVTGDVTAVGDIFSSSAGTLATSALTLIGMVVVGFLIDPLLAIVAFATTPFVAYLAFRFRHRMGALQRRQRQMEGEIASLATEALSSMEQIKALGTERFEHARLERKSEERRLAGFEATIVEGQFTRLIDIVGALATAVVLVIGVFRVSDGALSPGDLIVMVTYVRRVYKPLRDVAREWVRFSRSMARAERVAELLSADDLLEERTTARRRVRATGSVEFEAVSFAYRPDRPALDNISLAIPAGQRLAVVGPSGAGKSTLAALAARFYDPTAGRVLIDGMDARELPLAWLREQIGLVLQDPVLFTGSVADNISWGIVASPEEIVRAAEAVGADGFIQALPQGYATPLDPGGTGLSGGQRQRIAIARTLLRDPAVLLLDEPTTGLDAASERQVLAGLDVLMAGRTTVIITHSRDLARRADRVAEMAAGRLVRTGSPRDLLTEDAVVVPVRTDASSQQTITDPALPQLPILLDTTAVTPILGRSFNGGTPLDVKVRYLRYKPATNLVVEYDVAAYGRHHAAVAMIATGDKLARRAIRPEAAALATAAASHSAAAAPLSYEADIKALIQWYPLDLAMPDLARPPRELRSHLRTLGIDVADSDAEHAVLSYKPRRRAVLRVDGHVVRIYADPGAFARAATAQRAASTVHHPRLPRLEALDETRRIAVHSYLDGDSCDDAVAVASGAGEALRALHGAETSGAPTFTGADQLAAARATARLIATVDPALAQEVEDLVTTLAANLPAGEQLVPSHGDFGASQLLRSDTDELAIVDLDEFCLAAPALDPTGYATELIRGDSDDLETAYTALDELLVGYGGAPANLRWYLASAILREAAWPFRRFEADWPDRVGQMVGHARQVLAHA